MEVDSIIFWFVLLDDVECVAELDPESREFWAYFGGFAPIGEKAFDENEFIPKTTAPAIYRYFGT